MNREENKNEKRVVIYTQTSGEDVAATSGGHGVDLESTLRVASGHQPGQMETTTETHPENEFGRFDKLHDAIMKQGIELQEQLSALAVDDSYLGLSQESAPTGLIDNLTLSDEELDINLISASSDRAEGSINVGGCTSATIIPNRRTEQLEQVESANADFATLLRQSAMEVVEENLGGADHGPSGKEAKEVAVKPSSSAVLEAKEKPASPKKDSTSYTATDKGKSKTRTKEQKAKDGYKRSCSFLRKFEGKDSALLSKREIGLIKSNWKTMTRIEREYPNLDKSSTLISTIPFLKEWKGDATTARPVTAKPLTVLENTAATSKPDTANQFSKTDAEKRPSQTNESFSAPKKRKGKKQSLPPLEIPSTSRKTNGESRDSPNPTKCVKRVRSTEEPKPLAKRQSTKTTPEMAKSGSINPRKALTKSKAASMGKHPLRKPAMETARPQSNLSGKTPEEKDSTGSMGDHTVAIIDRSDADGKISPERWLQLEGRLMDLMLSEQWSSSEVQFDGAAWQRGVKVISCTNKESLDFLLGAVNGLGETWSGAKLEVVPMSALPLRPTAAVWIPPPIMEKEKILKLLAKQNAGLRTEDWQILSSTICAENGGLDLRVKINHEAKAFLRTCDGRVKLGFGTIRFRLLHPEEKRKPGQATHSAN